MKKSLQVYGVGGCAMKLVHTHLTVDSVKGYAKPSIAVLDSSKSDVDYSNPNQEISHSFVENADGFGKDRIKAAKVIRPYIEPFMLNSAPGNVNIVIFSLSGATGSTGGLMVVDALLEKNENVIVMAVANAANQREAVNSLSALSDLNKLSKKHDRVIPIMYYENTTFEVEHHGNAMKQSDVNKEVAKDFRALCCMFSGDHVGIDSKDVTNFLNYNTVSKAPAGLVEVCPVFDDSDLDNYENDVLSVMVVSKDPDYTVPDLKHRYGVSGVWSKDITDKLDDSEVQDKIILITTIGALGQVLTKLKTDNIAFKRAEEQTKTDPFADIDLDGFEEDAAI